MVFKRGQFKINGIHSEEFNVYMRNKPERLSAGRVIELRERQGNDSIVIDYGYYKNSELKIECYAKAKKLEEVPFLEQEITHWLDMGSYSDFIVYYDEHYIYQAIVIEPPNFTGKKKHGLLIPFDFKISIRPFKMARTGLRWISFKNNRQKLISIEKYPSKPLIHILGLGDISFWINDEKFELKGISNEIIIDSMIEESYRKVDGVIESQDDKTYFRDFPSLPQGESVIRYEGKVEKFEIQPRWWTKI